MEKWQQVNLHGALDIKRQVSILEIGDAKKFGMYDYRMKVLLDRNGLYTGHLNIAMKDKNGYPLWVIGEGKTEEEAIEDTLLKFYNTLEGYTGSPDDIWDEFIFANNIEF